MGRLAISCAAALAGAERLRGLRCSAEAAPSSPSSSGAPPLLFAPANPPPALLPLAPELPLALVPPLALVRELLLPMAPEMPLPMIFDFATAGALRSLAARACAAKSSTGARTRSAFGSAGTRAASFSPSR